MKINRHEVTSANVAYQHREVSSQVERDGVTAGVIRLETDDGLSAGVRPAAAPTWSRSWSV